MAENLKTVPEATEPQETTEKTSFFQKVKSIPTKHPRAARIFGVTAAVGAVVGAVVMAKHLKDEDVDGELLQLDSQQDPSYLGPETTTVAEA